MWLVFLLFPTPIFFQQKALIMNTQPAIPCPTLLTNQPTTWPLFFVLPQTHYVKRQRAVNSPEYRPTPIPAVPDYGPTSKQQSYLQRCTHHFSAARNKAWLALKRLGREVVHSLVKWCLLPLAVAACFAMVEVAPAELPAGYYTVEDTSLMAR
jgi:hypothetical protein